LGSNLIVKPKSGDGAKIVQNAESPYGGPKQVPSGDLLSIGGRPHKQAGVIGARMRVTINGEDHAVEPSTLATLIASLGLDLRKVAVERNL
jgi:hypothetical protein